MAFILAYNQHPNPDEVFWDTEKFNRLWARAKHVEKSLANQVIQTLAEAMNSK